MPPTPQADVPAAHATETDRNFGIAIARAFDVLRCYSPATPLLGISDIARMTGLPKATVSRLTYTLEQLGYLYRLLPTGKYRLGWGVLSLGYPLLTGMPLRHLARPLMHALAKEMGANVNLGTFDRLNVIFVESARFDETSAARPDIGVSHSLLGTVMGRTLLQSLRDGPREALGNRLRLADEAAWEAAQPALAEARRDLERQGFHVSRNANFPGVVVVAAPMTVPDYETPLVFNCALPLARAGDGEPERIVGPRLVGMAQTLAIQLGYR